MRLEPDRDVLDLRCGEILRLRDAAGVFLECRRGLLWITQEGDGRDVALSAGQGVRISKDGITLVEALESAMLMLEGCWAALGIHQPPLFVSDEVVRS